MGMGAEDIELTERESGSGGRFPLRGVAKATSSKYTPIGPKHGHPGNVQGTELYWVDMDLIP